MSDKLFMTCFSFLPTASFSSSFVPQTSSIQRTLEHEFRFSYLKNRSFPRTSTAINCTWNTCFPYSSALSSPSSSCSSLAFCSCAFRKAGVDDSSTCASAVHVEAPDRVPGLWSQPVSALAVPGIWGEKSDLAVSPPLK